MLGAEQGPAPPRRCLAALTEGGKVKAEVVVLPDGEQFKSLEVLQRVWDKVRGSPRPRPPALAAPFAFPSLLFYSTQNRKGAH